MGADQITFGPPSATGTNATNQKAIVLDQTNGVLYSSGASRQLMTAMSAPLVLTSQTPLTNVTTARQLLSYGFNAGALNVIGRKIRVKGRLLYNTTAANVATITIAVTLGGVGVCSITTAATNTAASTNLPIQFEFELTTATLGATATIEAHGKVDANIGTVASAAVATYLDGNSAVSGAVNLTAAATLAVNISASAALPAVGLRSATVMYEA